ncbi:MAG: SCP-like extracellular [Candidatus Electrothrix sp. ATG2]|nr:SCP-like extracellular [Candidatus Electrothrix sp. ATG2]
MKKKGAFNKNVNIHQGLPALTAIFLLAAALSACSGAQTNGPQPGRDIRSTGGTEAVPRQNGEDQLADKYTIDSKAMTAAHNRWRSQVNVPDLQWSEKLADIAQSWADTLKKDGCGFYHSHNGYGENLFIASPLSWSDGRSEMQDITPQEVTDSWGDEIKEYHYADNSCSGVCGHYTQVVWKDTREVGCARAVCDDNAQIWVCSYSPAGNLVGQKPY